MICFDNGQCLPLSPPLTEFNFDAMLDLEINISGGPPPITIILQYVTSGLNW